jgi:hypothetical protein
MFDFQPGDIVFTRENTVMSWLIRLAQGDCDWSHVCLADGAGRIHTTGGKQFAWYGAVAVDRYLKGKTFAVGRYEGLTPDQAEQLLATSRGFFGSFYPFWKVIRLAATALQGKTVHQISAEQSPRLAFCSEAVAYCYRQAGIRLAPKTKKAQPAAYTPECIFDDARVVIVHTQPL